MDEGDQAEKERSRDEWNAQRDADREEAKRLREEEKGTISWKLKFRDGRVKDFVSPIRTTPWGSIKAVTEYSAPSDAAFDSQELAHEPEYLKIEGGLPTYSGKFKEGVV